MISPVGARIILRVSVGLIPYIATILSVLPSLITLLPALLRPFWIQSGIILLIYPFLVTTTISLNDFDITDIPSTWVVLLDIEIQPLEFLLRIGISLISIRNAFLLPYTIISALLLNNNKSMILSSPSSLQYTIPLAGTLRKSVVVILLMKPSLVRVTIKPLLYCSITGS